MKLIDVFFGAFCAFKEIVRGLSRRISISEAFHSDDVLWMVVVPNTRARQFIYYAVEKMEQVGFLNILVHDFIPKTISLSFFVKPYNNINITIVPCDNSIYQSCYFK